ncbi:hypothetical protein DPMN_111337 [Dreissena polymorpha]|uniref:SUEL-type lectin domain-containing protein n=1 Tax=Dreissena polymorpha TaxID=45954 RepID=A0A9D4KEE6_DREPO|nr:hypothetical protein DPMN_111337 [Dreissena polymorpha]
MYFVYIAALGSVIVCENSSLYLSCPFYQRIYVGTANYGRTRGKIICDSKWTPNYRVYCRSATSTSIVRRMCNGKTLCNVPATNRVFGDPCIGIFKYLEVQYACF